MTDREYKSIISTFLPCVLVKSMPQFTQQLDIAAGLLVVLRIFVINIESIETVVLQ